MGEMEVPADALYGASTQRAVLNFPISGQRLPRRFLRALALIKQAAAETNGELGLLDADVAEAIAAAADRGRRRRPRRPVPDRHLPDGLGHLDQHEHERGRRAPRHGRASAAARSTRTTTSTAASPRTTSIPTALQLSAAVAIEEELLPALERLHTALVAEEQAVLAGRQDRPDAPPGRDADPARAGVPRLRRPGRGSDPPGAGRPGRAARRCRSAGPRSGPASTPTPSTRSGRAPGCRTLTGLDRPRDPEPLPRPGHARRRRSPPTARCGRSRCRSGRSPRTCG